MMAVIDKETSESLRQAHFGTGLPRKRFLRVDEVAEAIGFSQSFVHKLLESGSLFAHKHNAATGAKARWRVSREAVVLYLVKTSDYSPEDFLAEILDLIGQRSPQEMRAIYQAVGLLLEKHEA